MLASNTYQQEYLNETKILNLYESNQIKTNHIHYHSMEILIIVYDNQIKLIVDYHE
jgi:hypothetical protein